MRTTLAIVLGLTLAGVGTIAVASRNASGTYSLAAGNPVVTGTAISSTWANNTLSDISTELTDSLSRSGKGGMLAALRTVDGTVAAPGWSFTNETGTGLYRIGASDVGLALAGSKALEINAALTTGAVYSNSAALTNTDPGYTVGTTGWTQLGTTGVYYRRHAGVVYVRGTSGSIVCSGAGNSLGTLPVGSRPGASSYVHGIAADGANGGAWSNSDGTSYVHCYGGATQAVSVGGSFLAEQ